MASRRPLPTAAALLLAAALLACCLAPSADAKKARPPRRKPLRSTPSSGSTEGLGSQYALSGQELRAMLNNVLNNGGDSFQFVAALQQTPYRQALASVKSSFSGEDVFVPASRNSMINEMDKMTAAYKQKANALRGQKDKYGIMKWKDASLTTRIGAGVAGALLAAGIAYLKADGGCTVFNGDCGSCRNFYASINSGDPFQTQQGPILLFQGGSFEYGRNCETWTTLLITQYTGAGKVGNTPRTSFVGVEGTITYVVLDFDGNKLDCFVKIYLDNPFIGSNTHSISKTGSQCADSLRVEAGQYVQGTTAEVEFFVYFDSEFAAV